MDRHSLASLVASLLLLLSTTPNAFAEDAADLAAGERLFKRCSVCHRPDANESRRGPLLEGVVERPAAASPDYPYSDAMRAAAANGLVWTEAELATFLKRPQAMIKGTWMAFPGFGKAKDIRDIIAYLKRHRD